MARGNSSGDRQRFGASLSGHNGGHDRNNPDSHRRRPYLPALRGPRAPEHRRDRRGNPRAPGAVSPWGPTAEAAYNASRVGGGQFPCHGPRRRQDRCRSPTWVGLSVPPPKWPGRSLPQMKPFDFDAGATLRRARRDRLRVDGSSSSAGRVRRPRPLQCARCRRDRGGRVVGARGHTLQVDYPRVTHGPPCRRRSSGRSRAPADSVTTRTSCASRSLGSGSSTTTTSSLSPPRRPTPAATSSGSSTRRQAVTRCASSWTAASTPPRAGLREAEAR